MSDGARGEARSASIAIAQIPNFLESFSASSVNTALERATRTTFIPREASTSAKTFPIPFEAPVTRAHEPREVKCEKLLIETFLLKGQGCYCDSSARSSRPMGQPETLESDQARACVAR